MSYRRNVTLALAVLPLLSGCLIDTTNRSHQSGRRIGEETFSKVQPGETKDYVLALFGQPTSRTHLDDGRELWKWEYSETRTSGGTVFLVFSGKSTTEKQGAVFVELREGVVERVWRD